jgi:hypothetical protein
MGAAPHPTIPENGAQAAFESYSAEELLGLVQRDKHQGNITGPALHFTLQDAERAIEQEKKCATGITNSIVWEIVDQLWSRPDMNKCRLGASYGSNFPLCYLLLYCNDGGDLRIAEVETGALINKEAVSLPFFVCVAALSNAEADTNFGHPEPVDWRSYPSWIPDPMAQMLGIGLSASLGVISLVAGGYSGYKYRTALDQSQKNKAIGGMIGSTSGVIASLLGIRFRQEVGLCLRDLFGV